MKETQRFDRCKESIHLRSYNKNRARLSIKGRNQHDFKRFYKRRIISFRSKETYSSAKNNAPGGKVCKKMPPPIMFTYKDYKILDLNQDNMMVISIELVNQDVVTSLFLSYSVFVSIFLCFLKN